MTRISTIRTALASASLAAIALTGSALYAQADPKLDEKAGPPPEATYVRDADAKPQEKFRVARQ